MKLFGTTLFWPQTILDAADNRSELSALVVNALSGMFLVASFFLPWLSLIKISLLIVLSLLFGPLVGFVFSSTYARSEWLVGRKLGGAADYSRIYCLFAWSFLSVGLAVFLSASITMILDKLDRGPAALALAPLLIVLGFVARSYSLNLAQIQQLPLKRTVASMLMSFLLFVFMLTAGLFILAMLINMGMGEDMKLIEMLGGL
jgi:hypothetical protein